MCPLPHFTIIDTAKGNFEPIYKNLYEVSIVIPTALQSLHPDATHFLLENTTSAKFPTYPELEIKEQRFKYSTRAFLGMPTKTHAEFDIKFNLNQNDAFQVFCFRIIKDWYDLGWNNEDGSLHYKRNMLGTITIDAHDREGHIIRRVVYNQCQMQGFTGWEDMDWSSSDLQEMTVKWVSDYYQDFYY